MQLTKLFRASVAAVGVAVLTAACTEVPSSPTMVNSAEISLARRQRTDSGVATFMLDPTVDNSGKIGDHHIYVAANTICDPSRSGYGPEYFDAPCELATNPIPMVATWFIREGRAQVRFSPDLRFAPTNDPAKFAKLTMRQADGDVSPLSNILWWSYQSHEWVDESAKDPSLAPWVEPGGNRISRRLKHFSGYVVGTFCDSACAPPPDVY